VKVKLFDCPFATELATELNGSFAKEPCMFINPIPWVGDNAASINMQGSFFIDPINIQGSFF